MHSRDRTAEFFDLVREHRPTYQIGRRPLGNQNLQRALQALREPSHSLPKEQALRVALRECDYAQTNAPNDEARRHWCEAARLVQHWHGERRQLSVVHEAQGLERELLTIVNLYEIVSDLVSRQAHTIGDIEQNVSVIEARVDSAHDLLFDAAPRAYRTRQWRWYRQYLPQSLLAKLRCALLCLLVVNLLVVFALFA